MGFDNPVCHDFSSESRISNGVCDLYFEPMWHDSDGWVVDPTKKEMCHYVTGAKGETCIRKGVQLWETFEECACACYKYACNSETNLRAVGEGGETSSASAWIYVTIGIATVAAIVALVALVGFTSGLLGRQPSIKKEDEEKANKKKEPKRPSMADLRAEQSLLEHNASYRRLESPDSSATIITVLNEEANYEDVPDPVGDTTFSDEQINQRKAYKQAIRRMSNQPTPLNRNYVDSDDEEGVECVVYDMVEENEPAEF